jgi:hypothetical protein
MLFPWTRLKLCKHCSAHRVAPDAARCPNCDGTLPGQYMFPLDHLRLYFRNPFAAVEPLIGWFIILILLMVLLSALTGGGPRR